VTFVIYVAVYDVSRGMEGRYGNSSCVKERSVRICESVMARKASGRMGGSIE